MTMQLKVDLSTLYERAITSYTRCIRDEENKYLQDEVSVPLEYVIPFEKDVRFIFSGKSPTEYIIEISLSLLVDNELVGNYLYTVNSDLDGIDDALTFY